MHRISKKVVTLQPKGCENGAAPQQLEQVPLRSACTVFAHKMAIWWL